METASMSSIIDIPESVWVILSTKKLYFGHQSVGNNILDGVRKIMAENRRIKLNIVETDDPGKFDRAIWAHSLIGENGDPASKLKAFKANIQKGIGNKADIVFFKFCFWDIRSHTDINKVFNDYKTTLDKMKKEFPHLKFIHFTVPLIEYPDGWVVRARRMLGMPVGFDEDNIKRNELNKLILENYSGKEPVVDIALLESTLPDGKRVFFLKGGRSYPYLASVYTSDGGHLNEEGRRRVAEQVLIVLARIAETES